DGWRGRWRAAWYAGDRQTLRQLAASSLAGRLPRVALALAGVALGGEPGLAFLRETHRLHPDDFWINHQLHWGLTQMQPPRWEEALPYALATVALRPQSPGARVNLGKVLGETGRHEEAMGHYRQAIALKPDYAEAHSNLGLALSAKGRPEEAISCLR